MPVIGHFRGSRKRKKGNHMIVHVEDCDSREKAEKLVGKKVTWTSPADKKISGKVSAPHGNKGAVRVIFDTGMPGQSIGKEVNVD